MTLHYQVWNAPMRGLTSFTLLVAVLLGLSSYIYFSPSKRGLQAGEVTLKAFEIPKDQIEQLVFKPATGDASIVTKTGGGWQITSPLDEPADGALMTRVVSLVSRLEIVRVVDEHPTDLAQYGLAPPQGELTIQMSGGGGLQHVLLGAKAPLGATVYAQVSPSPRLILIAGELAEAANRSPRELRDNAVFQIDRDTIDGLEIDVAGRAVRLARQGVDWEMVKPLRTHGDLGVVSELLTKLKSLQMASIAESPAAASTYRLDKPVSTVTLAAGSSRETIQIGARADGANTWARNLSRSMVFTIPTSVADAITGEAGQYRRKDVFEFQAIDAASLEVARNGQVQLYVKAPGADGKWRQQSPAARSIDSATVDSALSKLSYLRAVAFVPATAARTSEADVVSVLVTSDEGKKSESVRFKTVGSAPLAMRGDWPDAARLDASAYELLIKALDDLEE